MGNPNWAQDSKPQARVNRASGCHFTTSILRGFKLRLSLPRKMWGLSRLDSTALGIGQNGRPYLIEGARACFYLMKRIDLPSLPFCSPKAAMRTILLITGSILAMAPCFSQRPGWEPATSTATVEEQTAHFRKSFRGDSKSQVREKETAELVREEARSLAIETEVGGVPFLISRKRLENALFPQGATTAIEDFSIRFTNFLEQLVNGRDRTKVPPFRSEDESGEIQ